MTTTEALHDSVPAGDPAPVEPAPVVKQRWEQVALFLFLVVPFLGLAAAIPVAWGWGLSWRDVVIAGVMYVVTANGVTVGFHRHFTHKAFKARRWLQVSMAIAGMMSIQGPVLQWVADHRKHHRFSDNEGDPHSPWRYGNSLRGLTKGFFYSHFGWLFDEEQTPQDKFVPDLVKDKAIAGVSRAFPVWVVISMLFPPLVGGLWSWSWQGALTAFFWGSLVRVALLHHVTFSINSVCHITGKSPFKTKDHSRNVWWLAIPSMGESWHNFHHSEPTSARHGVGRMEIDISAAIIWVFERLRLVSEVRWPDKATIARRRMAPLP
jgi:stearoyl-CoA desaturase (Delta-9 desaturase)